MQPNTHINSKGQAIDASPVALHELKIGKARRVLPAIGAKGTMVALLTRQTGTKLLPLPNDIEEKRRRRTTVMRTSLN